MRHHALKYQAHAMRHHALKYQADALVSIRLIAS
jgi:hypothetical protein